MSLISNTTAKLTSAVSSLPQLLEQKRLLDMHTTIATGKHVLFKQSTVWLLVELIFITFYLKYVAILEQIKQRKLDVLLEVEEKVMSKNVLDRSILDIISDPEFGTPDDKLRLFLVFFICSPNMTDVIFLFLKL